MSSVWSSCSRASITSAQSLQVAHPSTRDDKAAWQTRWGRARRSCPKRMMVGLQVTREEMWDVGFMTGGKLKVVTVIGTRPEIIRLSRVIAKLDQFCDHTLVHTGQNYD